MIEEWYNIHGLVKIHLNVSEKNSSRVVGELLSSFRSKPLDDSEIHLEFLDSLKITKSNSTVNAGGFSYDINDKMVWDSHGAVKVEPSGKIQIYTNTGIDKFVLTSLLVISLTRQHFGLCHAMGIVVEDEAILFPAWKRTGKTGLFNYFLQKENIKVLGDELMIISPQGEVFKLPYPLIIQHYHAREKPTALAKAYRKKRSVYLGYSIDLLFNYIVRPLVSLLSLVSPALVRFLKRNAPERGITSPLEEIVPPDRVINQAKLKQVINLVRGYGEKIKIEKCAHKEMVPEIISMLYQGELYSSPNVERFIQYWLVLNAFGAVESWQSILSGLEHVLEEALKHAQCYRMTLPQTAKITEIGKYLDNFI